MKTRKQITIDGAEAAASVAYRIGEVMAIYPITPSTPLAEWQDTWASQGKTNIWGTVPSVVELQSEGGAVASLHGAVQTGSLCATFTASQGLLLMIPTMYKLAGELMPCVFHVTARALATHALSIFGDHSDVMSIRQTGFGMLASNSVQEAQDFALISTVASLESRIPFVHFFDGFRTSHEYSKIEILDDDDLKAMVSDDLVLSHRQRAMTPDRPVLRGTAQNPDVYFQERETVNKYYQACPEITQKVMDKFGEMTGRQYKLYEYAGAPDAERVIVIMCSGAETVHETVDFMNAKGAKVGVLKVRLFRPFDVKRFAEALPATVKTIAVLDRTKEPGSAGEPMYLDCVAAVTEAMEKGWGSLLKTPHIVGGRYGLSSKEFTPAMVKAIYDNLAEKTPKNHFTIGIKDDVTMTSLNYDPNFSTEPSNVIRAMFYGLGSDGTVGANRNSIKIIGENTDNYAQAYFVYDSKKAGAMTVSHLRFGPNPIRSIYLVNKANFVACHQPFFLERYDMLQPLVEGGTFLLNTPYGPEAIWDKLPQLFQHQLISKKLKFYVIDAYKVAKETGMGSFINTIMQVCFFAISGVLPREQAIASIKKAIQKSYASKGEEVVNKNLKAVDQTLENLHEVKLQGKEGQIGMPAPFSGKPPKFVEEVLGVIYAGKGEDLPVSAFPVDGTFPTGTSQYEKRNIAQDIPVWEPELCIQCAKCSLICPHAAIRPIVYDASLLSKAPATFKSTDAKDKDFKGMKYTLQVAPEDCTGCGLCVEVCPAKSKTDPAKKAINMSPQAPLRMNERDNWFFFLSLPPVDRLKLKINQIRQQQFQVPLFEFSSACAGCGETPYLKLLSQLFGDRAIVANATGCSSIYGGNLPTTPWAKNAKGRGPSWANSLFEDAAEFGFGFRLSIDKQKEFAAELVKKLSGTIGQPLADAILNSPQKDEADIEAMRERVKELKEKLKGNSAPEAKELLSIADMLVKKSVWIVGGDGWAYDIGFGGLDHVLSSGRNVNVLVLDTEMYSNTGGQMSKSTPKGATAKFAAGGKVMGKKDLGMIAMTYGNIYVARVSLGAKDEQVLKAFLEAEAYDGPSLIIAYAHCREQGINTLKGLQQQKAAVDSGSWILYRYNPDKLLTGDNPLTIDSAEPKLPIDQYMYNENRFKLLTKTKPEAAKQMLEGAQADALARWKQYTYLAAQKFKAEPPAGGAPAA